MKFTRAKAVAAVSLLFTMSCGRQQQTASNQKVTPQASTSQSQSQNYPNLATQAKEVNDAFIRKDFGKVSDMTYAKVVQSSGGQLLRKSYQRLTQKLCSRRADVTRW